MLDADLANLYGVPTKQLLQAVKRNQARFPEDFMFQLSPDEARALRSQIVTSNMGRGGRRYLPYAFTEQGVALQRAAQSARRAGQHRNHACLCATPCPAGRPCRVGA